MTSGDQLTHTRNMSSIERHKHWIETTINTIVFNIVVRYASCTLLAAQTKPGEDNTILQYVQFLENNEFIRIQGDDEENPHRYTVHCTPYS